MFKFKIKTKKQKLSEECWNINYSFIVWLKEHLEVYLKEASKIVDLEYHKFQYQNKEYTQLEMINLMLDICNYLTLDEKYFDWEDETDKKIKELLEIFSLTFQFLWW